MKEMKWEIRHRSDEPGDEFIEVVVARGGVQQAYRVNVNISKDDRKDVRGQLAEALEELGIMLMAYYEDGGPLIGYPIYRGTRIPVQEIV
jgi:hypothetical protein